MAHTTELQTTHFLQLTGIYSMRDNYYYHQMGTDELLAEARSFMGTSQGGSSSLRHASVLRIGFCQFLRTQVLCCIRTAILHPISAQSRACDDERGQQWGVGRVLGGSSEVCSPGRCFRLVRLTVRPGDFVKWEFQ